MTEAKRVAELWIAAKLTTATAITFSANRGGTDPAGDAEELVGLCGLVQVTECGSPVHGSNLFQIVAVIGVMTHMGDTTAEQHGEAARKVLDAIRAMEKADYRDDAVAYDANLGIRVHGVDLRQSDDFTDEDMKTRGDAFTVAMGISV